MQAISKLLRAVPQPSSQLETLFRQHHELVFNLAYRITGSIVDAEDVLQTVFMRLATNEKEWSNTSENVAGYLSQAAVHAALDQMGSRDRMVGLDHLEDDDGTPQSTPELEQIDRELVKLIRVAVTRLGRKAAEIFVLRYYEGYDNVEIAKLTNTSPYAVGVVLHRARTKLRKEIGHYLEKHHEKQ